MIIYLVLLDVLGNAPELGYWFACTTLEQVAELAQKANIGEMPHAEPLLPGDLVEVCNGGMVEGDFDSAMKVFSFNMAELTHEGNIKALAEIMAKM